MRSLLPSLACAALLLGGAACTTEEHRPALVARTDDAWGDGLTITTTDGRVSMSLAHDTIAIRLSDAVMARVNRDLDAGHADTSGFGGVIERTVKTTVQRALDHQLAIPVAEVEDARYEDGRIVLELEQERHRRPDWWHSRTERRSIMKQFAPDDARRFVAAVRTARGL